MGLMIDTMCNGVGGLVLVAILIVLVSIGDSPSSSEGQMKRKQLENEVEALKIQEELLRSENLRMSENQNAFGEEFVGRLSVDEIEKQSTVIARKKQQIQELEKRLEALQQNQAQVEMADPGEYVAAELEVYNRLREEVEKLEAQLKQEQRDLALKEANYSELLSDVAEIKEQRSRTLSVPVERQYSRYDFIYFRNGRCYVLRRESVFSPGSDFRIIDQNEYSIEFEPKQGSGSSINSGEVLDFLSFVKRNGGTCQLGFYPDSFHLFLPIKQLIDEAGLSLGISFYTNDSPPSYTMLGGTKIQGQGQ
jgi:hypothetical protein